MAKEELDVLGQMLVARRVKQRLFGACAPLRGNRYVPLDRIGRGGGGTVYRAYDSKLRREVAIKLLHLSSGPSRAEVDQASKVVMREARSLASLAHPHVVAVHDVGRVANGELVSDLDQADPQDASVFLVMELVEGQDLGSYINEHRPSFEQILTLFEQAASGLSAAHEIGLVHRDFKPANVLVGKDGRVRVIDFGLARIAALSPEAQQEELSGTESSEEAEEGSGLVGTPAYMSPEAKGRQSIGPRSDQFSFCVAFYEALYGLRPEAYRTGEPLSRLSPVLHPLPPGTPDDFAERLAKGLQANPEQRYENMAQLMLALRSSRRRWLRRWWPAIAALLLGLVGWQCWQAWSPDPCREQPAIQRLNEQIDRWSKIKQDKSDRIWPRFAAKIEHILKSELKTVQRACHRAPALLQDPWTRFRRDAVDGIIALREKGMRAPNRLRLDAWLHDFQRPAPTLVASALQASDIPDAQWQRCKGALLAADLEWLRLGARATSQRQSLLTCLPPQAPELQIQVARRLARMQGASQEALRRAYFAALAQGRSAQASAFAGGLALELLERGPGWERAWEWYEHARALDNNARGTDPECAFLRYVAQAIHLQREPSSESYAQSSNRLAKDPAMQSYRWRLQRDAIDFERERGAYQAARALREGLREELQALEEAELVDFLYLDLQAVVDLLLEGKASQAEKARAALEVKPGAKDSLELRILSIWTAWADQNYGTAQERLGELTQSTLSEISRTGCQAYEEEQWRALLELEARILSAPGHSPQHSSRAPLQARCPFEQMPEQALDRAFSRRVLMASRLRFDEALRLLDPKQGRCPPSI